MAARNYFLHKLHSKFDYHILVADILGMHQWQEEEGFLLRCLKSSIVTNFDPL